MEAAVFILSLVDCCALIFLSVYFVSFRFSESDDGNRLRQSGFLAESFAEVFSV